MSKKLKDQELYMGTAKVGPKGQIVIPKEVRDMFGINPGDHVIILADSLRGIAIERAGFFRRVADEAFDRSAKSAQYSDLHPVYTQDAEKLQEEEE